MYHSIGSITQLTITPPEFRSISSNTSKVLPKVQNFQHKRLITDKNYAQDTLNGKYTFIFRPGNQCPLYDFPTKIEQTKGNCKRGIPGFNKQAKLQWETIA